jgi:hypothetical protein
LLEGGFEVVADLLGENVGIGKIIGVFEAFVSEPEDVETGFVATEQTSMSPAFSPLNKSMVMPDPGAFSLHPI